MLYVAKIKIAAFIEDHSVGRSNVPKVFRLVSKCCVFCVRIA